MLGKVNLRAWYIEYLTIIYLSGDKYPPLTVALRLIIVFSVYYTETKRSFYFCHYSENGQKLNSMPWLFKDLFTE